MLFGTEGFEIELLKALQSFFGCEFINFLMPKISALGNSGFIWILYGVLMLFVKRYRKHGALLLIGLLLGLLIGNVFLKNIISRPRPCWLDTSVPLLIASPTDFSFPSGHTLSSFIAAFTIYYANKKWGCFALALAVVIAFSRMYLFVHFPTDVLAGVLLGFGISRLLIFTARKTYHLNT